MLWPFNSKPFYAVLMPDLLVYFAHNVLNNLLVFTQLIINKNGEVYNSKKKILII